MRCLYAHIPSHSPTLSHIPTPSVVTVTDDIHILSLCWLTNTQCKCQWKTKSLVSLDSYHQTLSLGDNHDRVFFFGQQNFLNFFAGILHRYRNFRISPAVFFLTFPKKIKTQLERVFFFFCFFSYTQDKKTII